MKRMIASLLCCAFISISCPAAHASAFERRLHTYKVFHYAVYMPIQIVSFLLAGPVILVDDIVQHHDDELLRRVQDAE